MKFKRTLITLLALTGLAVAAGGAWAWGHHRGHDAEQVKKFVEWRLNDVLDDLEADAAQRARIMALKDKMVKSVEATLRGRTDTRATLLAQWNADTPDKAAIHALIDARADAWRALAHEMADAALEAHDSLGPKQRAAVAEMISERWQR